ncbi:ABC transporter permease [Kiloniella laminariae]|uniref:ABC transporter permease n=1 Tax=Kiloniella laminariae TaxID=454162 RepID=A0ABT4LRT2_9PROT|nr:ABC transporter permease [Kiloniella laminariae]MCZ4283036.1 ABC transporter permease [Kiloniella laminariae]
MSSSQTANNSAAGKGTKMSSLRSLFDFLRRQSIFSLLCLAIFLFLILAAISAPWITPQNPYDNAQVDFFDANLAPGTVSGDGRFVYLLGSDALGRDLYSAILYGLRTSLSISGTAALLALAIGTLAGLAAAYFKGATDMLIMRAVDIKLGFPTILVAMVIMSIFGAGYFNLVIALVLAQWPYYARTARSVALVQIGQEYIEAARCLELPVHRLILVHLLPNSLPPLLVVFTLQLAHAAAIEASLSFLGLGVSIEAPSLGLLIANGSKEILSGHSWQLIYPGLALVLLIFTVNIVGDRLRRILNPKERG